MTTTYDPKDPTYLDEASVREELTRVYDVCQGCRLCVELCGSFPTLFEMVDRFDDRDAGRLTPFQQDQVVDECVQCKLCYAECPYVPELHEWQLDFPRLMLRAEAMRHANGQQPVRRRIATQALARTDLLGKLATTRTPLVGRVVRRLLGRVAPPYAEQRFSVWFRQRASGRTGERQGRVTVFPTCVVEYQLTAIGKDLVRAYERIGVECSHTAAGCCGAPWLHSGDIGRFTKVAEKNVRILADEARAGTDIVVPRPACAHVLQQDYIHYVTDPARRADAQLVAEHTVDYPNG